jgi:hypothetical protein
MSRKNTARRRQKCRQAAALFIDVQVEHQIRYFQLKAKT